MKARMIQILIKMTKLKEGKQRKKKELNRKKIKKEMYQK